MVPVLAGRSEDVRSWATVPSQEVHRHRHRTTGATAVSYHFCLKINRLSQSISVNDRTMLISLTGRQWVQRRWLRDEILRSSVSDRLPDVALVQVDAVQFHLRPGHPTTSQKRKSVVIFIFLSKIFLSLARPTSRHVKSNKTDLITWLETTDGSRWAASVGRWNEAPERRFT